MSINRKCFALQRIQHHTECRLGRNPGQTGEVTYELKVSTRDRPARTGADARIEGSGAKGEVGLALRPYGRAFKLGLGSTSEYGHYVKPLRGAPRGIPTLGSSAYAQSGTLGTGPGAGH